MQFHEGEVPLPFWLSDRLSSQAPQAALGLGLRHRQERWWSSVP